MFTLRLISLNAFINVFTTVSSKQPFPQFSFKMLSSYPSHLVSAKKALLSSVQRPVDGYILEITDLMEVNSPAYKILSTIKDIESKGESDNVMLVQKQLDGLRGMLKMQLKAADGILIKAVEWTLSSQLNLLTPIGTKVIAPPTPFIS